MIKTSTIGTVMNTLRSAGRMVMGPSKAELALKALHEAEAAKTELKTVEDFGGEGLLKTIGFGPKHGVFEQIKILKDTKAQIEAMIPLAVNTRARTAMEKALADTQAKISGKEAYVQRMKDSKQGLSSKAGILGVGAVMGGGAYAANKIGEPDMGDEYKLAEDWVQGFITKCAAYNIDGRTWLNSELDEVARTGIIKKSGLLSKLLGLGVLGVGGGALAKGWRSVAVRNKQRADAAAEEAKKSLLPDREKDINSWRQNQGGGWENERLDYEKKIKAIDDAHPAAVKDLGYARPVSDLVTKYEGGVGSSIAPALKTIAKKAQAAPAAKTAKTAKPVQPVKPTKPVVPKPYKQYKQQNTGSK